MPQIDEFYIFLLVGLGLLILGAIIFNVGFGLGPGAHAKEIVKVRSESFPLDASKLRTYTRQSLGRLQLYNGLLFGKRAYSMNVTSKDIVQLSVDMDVKKTNDYGNLVLRTNDNVVLDQKLIVGNYTIPINRSMYNGHALVKIETESSWWRIWAPNYYDVDAYLNYVTYDQHKTEYRFTIGSETLQGVQLEFTLDKSIGTVQVTLNNATLFSGSMDRTYELTVDKYLVKRGANTVTIDVDDNSVYSGNAFVKISYVE